MSTKIMVKITQMIPMEKSLKILLLEESEIKEILYGIIFVQNG
jgi:hypothetical protein